MESPAAIPHGVYALVDPDQCGGRDPLVYTKDLLAAGVRLVQLRDKNYRAGRALELAQEMAALCRQQQALLIINDRMDVALLAGGGVGLHLGPDDLPVASARRALPESAVLGRSTNELDEALRAYDDGADYVAFGPLYDTVSKTGSRMRARRSLADLARLCRELPCPVYAIGGIGPGHVEEIAFAGAAGVAVIGALASAKDLAAAAARLAAPWRKK